MRTSDAARIGAWALVAGCCAGHPVEVATTGPKAPAEEVAVKEDTSSRPSGAEFVAIEVEEAARRLWPRPGPSAYAPASAAEQAALVALVGRMLVEDATPSGLAADARAAGYVVEGWLLGGDRVLAAVEAADRRRGGGAYVVRVGAKGAELLQAPHGFFDVGTERIGLEMFAEDGAWRALFVNTIHRYVGTDGVKRKQDASPADPCHNPEHALAAATAGALERVAGARVVQLHGFGDEEEGPAFAAIVSGGARPATAASEAAAERLRAALGEPVALFPDDTDRLGATTNVQGRAIRAFNERGGAATFVHVELSAAARRQLRADPGLRRRVAAALRAPASGS